MVASTSMQCKKLSFSGACFLRTDQMDGETDWKLRLTVAPCQRLPCDAVSHDNFLHPMYFVISQYMSSLTIGLNKWA